jgi:hypothetical protein
MMAWTLSPFFNPNSSTDSLVMEAVTVVPLTSMRTWAVVAPFLMSTIVPGSALRAEILIYSVLRKRSRATLYRPGP